MTDDAQPPVVVDTWYITTRPWSPSYPLKFVKDGTNVTVTGVLRTVSGTTNAINLPDLSLTPSALKQVTTSALTPFSYASSKKLGIYKKSASSFENSINSGHITVIIASGSANLYKTFTRSIDLTINTISLFITELKQALDSCNALITADHGLQVVSITRVKDQLFIEDINGNLVAVYITTSATLEMGWDGYFTASTVKYSGNVQLDAKLFEITTDSKLKNGDSILLAGTLNYVTDIFPAINYTYSLV